MSEDEKAAELRRLIGDQAADDTPVQLGQHFRGARRYGKAVTPSRYR